MVYRYRMELDDHKMPTLVREAGYGGATLATPEELAVFLNQNEHLGSRAEEHFYAVALDTRLHALGVFEVSHGTVDYSTANPREVFIRLLLAGAVRFALAHNHPSGDCTPSEPDVKVTKLFSDAGKLMRLPLVDHIILGENSTYCSMHEQGLF